jgi:hypothetical protein
LDLSPLGLGDLVSASTLGGPDMKFFIAKLVHDDGDLAHPWSLFAEDIAAAAARFDLTGVKELVLRERPLDEASTFYGRKKPGPAAMHHTELAWED